MGQKKNIVAIAVNLLSIGVFPSKLLNVISILSYFRPVNLRPSVKIMLVLITVFELVHLHFVLHPTVELLKLVAFVIFILISSSLKIDCNYFKAISVLAVLFLVISYFLGVLYNPISGALNGIVGNSQGVMLIILPIFSYWLLDSQSRGRIIWTLFFGLALYQTQSRTGLLVAAFLVLVYLVRNRRILILAFMAIIIFINQSFLLQFLAKGNQSNDLTLATLNSRSNLIAEALIDLEQSNWMGVGFGFQPGHPEYDPTQEYYMSMPSERGSALFALLAELGFVGSALVCCLVWILLPKDKKYYRYAILLSLLAESSIFSLFYLGVYQSTLLFAEYE